MRIAVLAPVALLLFSACAASAGPAAQPAGLQITSDGTQPINWRWSSQPDGAQIVVTLNEMISASARKSAVARVECEVGKDQRVGGCKTLEETPGSDVARVVTQLAGHYKAASKDVAGAATAGRKVQFGFGTNR